MRLLRGKLECVRLGGYTDDRGMNKAQVTMYDVSVVDAEDLLKLPIDKMIVFSDGTGVVDVVNPGASWLQEQLKEMESILERERNQLKTEREAFKQTIAQKNNEISRLQAILPPPPTARAWTLEIGDFVARLDLPDVLLGQVVARGTTSVDVRLEENRAGGFIIMKCYQGDLVRWTPPERRRYYSPSFGAEFSVKAVADEAMKILMGVSKPETEEEENDPTAARFAGLDIQESEKP